MTRELSTARLDPCIKDSRLNSLLTRLRSYSTIGAAAYYRKTELSVQWPQWGVTGRHLSAAKVRTFSDITKKNIKIQLPPPAPPGGRSKHAIKRCERVVARHIENLYRTVYCPALRANVAFNRKTSRKEAMQHSSGDHDSTLFVLKIEQLLKTATIVNRQSPKPGNRQQAPFSEMVILEQKIKGYGKAKIVIGKYKPDYPDKSAPYCHYCVTRWGVTKKREGKTTVAPHATMIKPSLFRLQKYKLFFYMQRKILPLLLFSLLALTGCSCQQRLERLRRQCPECFTQTTAHVRDTLTVPEKILTGSVPWAWLPSGDTVLFQNRSCWWRATVSGPMSPCSRTPSISIAKSLCPALSATAASAAYTSTWPLPPPWWRSSPSGASPAKCD